jgi:glucan biosynthesis protein
MTSLIVKTDCRLHQYNTSNETLTLDDYKSFEESPTATLEIANWDDYKEVRFKYFMCYLNKGNKLQLHRYTFALTQYFDSHQSIEVQPND